MKNFRSCAEWNQHIPGFHQNCITKDEHHTKEQAEAVCKMLQRDGLGGDATHFPIRTWVEELKEIPIHDGFGLVWIKSEEETKP